MDTPLYYKDVCQEALDAKIGLDLTDTQTLLYNHICRKDFKLRNGDGQSFYDIHSEGFGWGSDRNWVKKQFKPLISKGLVKLSILKDCRSKRYTSWYFHIPGVDLNELIDAGCYVSASKNAIIKHYLNLPDGFSKKNQTYGDIEFIHNSDGYTFKYKGEASIYSWESSGKGGVKVDLSKYSWRESKNSYYDKPVYYPNFQKMSHDIVSFLQHDGFEYITPPNYTNKRRFKI